MSADKASQRPWEQQRHDEIWSGGTLVAITFGDDANAALIVRAVNSHDALVAALRETQRYLERLRNLDERGFVNIGPAISTYIDQARAALALAEQGGG